ncbi:hypothetical protein M0R19_03505 [Candidatus Pacearchaeota archaeon]|nr:hypothetical protein [Candidatus Pacearchaeota archaeon]
MENYTVCFGWDTECPICGKIIEFHEVETNDGQSVPRKISVCEHFETASLDRKKGEFSFKIILKINKKGYFKTITI